MVWWLMYKYAWKVGIQYHIKYYYSIESGFGLSCRTLALLVFFSIDLWSQNKNINHKNKSNNCKNQQSINQTKKINKRSTVYLARSDHFPYLVLLSSLKLTRIVIIVNWRLGLEQSGHHHHLIDLFSPWYSWLIPELALNNTHSLYQCGEIDKQTNENNNTVPDFPIGSIGWSLGPQSLGGLRPRCIIFF